MGDAQVTGGQNGSFTNSGSLKKSGTTGISTFGRGLDQRGLRLDPRQFGSLTLASLTNGGSISLASQAVLNVPGAFNQAATGSLNVAVAGAPSTNNFGQFHAGGVANLGGTLGVSLGTISGGGQFIPTVGQVFPVVTYGSASGNFSKITIPTINTNPAFSTSLQPPRSTLVALQTTPPAPTGLTALPGATTRTARGPRCSPNPASPAKTVPGLLVQILDQNQKLVASAWAGSDGTFIATPTTAMAVGSCSLFAVADRLGESLRANSFPYALTIVVSTVARTRSGARKELSFLARARRPRPTCHHDRERVRKLLAP